MRLWAARRLARRARPDNMVVTAEAEEPLAFASLPVDLLCSVAEELDVQSLASFAAASSACRAVAHEPLREALLKVLKRCLRGVRNLPPNPNRPQLTSAWETETFKGCGKNLKLLLLGNLTGVTSVGDNAFRDCSSLSKCVLPSGLVTIGTSAFELCTSLAELTLPATLTSIGDRAFSGCSSLTSLTFPASVVTIGHGAFFDCSSLTIVDFSAATDANIGRFAFVGCERLVKLTLPAALSKINNGTFSRCSALVELTLPITVTSIGTDAFDQCTSLAELTLPATLTSIGDYAFSGYTPPSHLSSLTFPASLVTTIGLTHCFVQLLLSHQRRLPRRQRREDLPIRFHWLQAPPQAHPTRRALQNRQGHFQRLLRPRQAHTPHRLDKHRLPGLLKLHLVDDTRRPRRFAANPCR